MDDDRYSTEASDDDDIAESTRPAGASAPSQTATFEAVEFDGSGVSVLPGRRGCVFLLGLGFLLVGAVEGVSYIFEQPVFWRWNPSIVDWLYYASVWTLSLYLVVPVVRRPGLTRHYWEQLRGKPAAVVSLLYLCVFGVVAVVGPVFVGDPMAPLFTELSPRQQLPWQPPVWSTVSEGRVACVGELVDRQCHGTWHYPLGTTESGHNVLALLILGANIALKAMVIVGTLMVPVGVAVGAVAGYLGGRVDEVLMRYVDIQQVLPGFFIILVLVFVYDGSLLLLVMVFGLLNWGGVARMVRSETLQTRESGFVLAARSTGARPFWIVRHHVIPNTASTVVTSLTHQLPQVILAEATMAFLFSGVSGRAHIWQEFGSWGFAISMGFIAGWSKGWWVIVFPGVALLATTLSISLLGDALRDVLDPRVDD